ncbi:MAG: hypothetical protein ACE5HE_10145 [Phycisphaerae bacterium]
MGFSLVELLTVMFIISLLIGLLLPSLNRARRAAKKSATLATLHALKAGLDMFRNDHERDFRQTNGYPPSFAHPKMPHVTTFDGYLGQFPFIDSTPPPVVTGAHWLPAMLLGIDGQGYVQRSTVPTTNNLPAEPWRWYAPPPDGPDPPLKRSALYVDPRGLNLKRTDTLPGKRDETLLQDYEKIKHLPVIADPFDQPILYYVASANGRTSNMLSEARNEDNLYSGGPQEKGPPYYFHQDNHAFTGHAEQGQTDYDGGWNFGSGGHAISRAGDQLSAEDIKDEANRDTFARFILDRKQYQSLQLAETNPSASTPLRPVNQDSYLLISAGADGRYGTNDDVTNFPTSVE